MTFKYRQVLVGKITRLKIRRLCALFLLGTVSLTCIADGALSSEESPGNTEFRVNAPNGAPNIVIVLLDDVGFGAASTFGGPVDTPVLDSLAKEGLRYNRFHTTGICSPTRSSLLTGRNPHATGIGSVMNSVDARPGYSGFHRKDTATIARILQQNGYATAAFGKWHQTPDWEASPAGPFDRWPTGEGFDYFYGFIGGETDQFDPSLYQGTRQIMRPEGDGYHLTADMANQAISWFSLQKTLWPDQPAFIYFAPGAAHAPLQAPRSYIDRYRGKFDSGWDNLREQTFARQKRLGVIPENAQLTERSDRIPDWASLSTEQKRVAARQMEVYAGFLTHTDEQVGRLIEMLKQSGEFANTIFFYIVGDNGGSGEGGLLGSGNYMGAFQGMPETDTLRLKEIDSLGGPESYPQYAAGWAWALDAPFQWLKTIASHLGATRNGMVVSWPKRIDNPGGLRSQFSHVNDIAPSILEAVGIKEPEIVDGVTQRPMDGTSIIYSFNDPDARGRHVTQYFEVMGHRSIYHDGWMASAFHARVPWDHIQFFDKPFESDKWELYHLDEDFSQAVDLSEKYPERLSEMKKMFLDEARLNQVLPLKNIVGSDKRGMPTIDAGRKSVTFSNGSVGIPESALPKIFNTSYEIKAAFIVDSDVHGVLAALGGRSAGWSIWIDVDGRPVLTYRLFNIKMVNIKGKESLSPGEHEVRFEFIYDGGGWAKGGVLKLFVDNQLAGSDSLPASPAVFFTLDETFNVGIDHGSPVANYPPGYALGYSLTKGKIKSVTINLGSQE